MPATVHSKKYAQLRARLIEARKSAGLTQVDLAGVLKRHQSFVSKYENGERRIDPIELIEIARAIGFDPADLIRDLDG